MTNCCMNCFRDRILQGVVKDLATKGHCDFCGSDDTYVYDLAQNVKLQSHLAMIAELYEPCKSSDSEPAHTFAYELTIKWHLFNLSENSVSKLLDAMCSESPSGAFDDSVMKELLVNDVRLKEFGSEADTEHDWEKFANHLKYHNRFFASFIDLEALGELITYIRTTCKPGVILTRARIAKDAEGFAPEKDMGAPPQGLAGNGRINPAGISELYTTLGDDAEADDTALHEIRAGMHDYVTFGKFILNRTITIVDLSRLDEISPFDIAESKLPLLAANLKILSGMSREISKPMRRGDDPLEYVPSQYIAEFIKSLKYDGVKYASTLRNGGMNLCLFDPTAYVCYKTYTKRVSEVAYSTVN